jgi:hypothetical protein
LFAANVAEVCSKQISTWLNICINLNMLSVYYKIWVDAITFSKQKTGEKGNWKLLTIIPISVIQGVNFLTILLWMRSLTHKETLVLFPVSIFSVGPFNTFLSILITFFIPFFILNYLLIFSNQRYKALIKIYNTKNGKLYMKYCLWSAGILIAPIILKWIF